jgi:hypothetical protein
MLATETAPTNWAKLVLKLSIYRSFSQTAFENAFAHLPHIENCKDMSLHP